MLLLQVHVKGFSMNLNYDKREKSMLNLGMIKSWKACIGILAAIL